MRALQTESFEARQAGIFIVAVTILSNAVHDFSTEMNAVVSSPALLTRLAVDSPSDLSRLVRDRAVVDRSVDLLCNNVDDCDGISDCATGSTCVDRVAGYHCLCPPGSSGQCYLHC